MAIIYNIGYPFVEVRSDWSTIYTQEFPEEYAKNVEILDIIAENNDEIKTKHFENILVQKGVISHIDDELQDQTIRYMHKAEHITSGFLTEERRIIPLDTKLQDFNTSIEILKSEVFGAASTNLIVTLADEQNTVMIKPDILNHFHTCSFKGAIDKSHVINFGTEDSPELAALSQLTLMLYNNGSYDMKLHSIFPGSPNDQLNPADNTMFPMNEYATNNESIYMMIDEKHNNNFFINQTYNQFLYFRRNLTDVYGTPSLYRSGTLNDIIVTHDNIEDSGVPSVKLLGNETNIIETLNDYSQLASIMSAAANGSRFACLYPYIGTKNTICSNTGDTFVILSPGESISIPINFVYWFKENVYDIQLKNVTLMKALSVTRMMSFDIRTSLYQDPINYKFIVDASYEDTISFELKKATVGLNTNKMQLLQSSTPKTVSYNATGAISGATISLGGQKKSVVING